MSPCLLHNTNERGFVAVVVVVVVVVVAMVVVVVARVRGDMAVWLAVPLGCWKLDTPLWPLCVVCLTSTSSSSSAVGKGLDGKRIPVCRFLLLGMEGWAGWSTRLKMWVWLEMGWWGSGVCGRRVGCRLGGGGVRLGR
ncbi:hypothetical protein E2C01_023475 [Portunus trituberculatus]|uniref:Transmembrane protein n=1 Tax=Portunus trituberculatus TaxID=210409 RepID=A0A5B7EAM9_PORTR|nr:hypothetical protein [Portunus trituberculatus]